MGKIVGVYPNAFNEAEGIAYFKGLKDPKSRVQFDPIYEQMIRNNFKTQEVFDAYVRKCETHEARINVIGE